MSMSGKIFAEAAAFLQVLSHMRSGLFDRMTIDIDSYEKLTKEQEKKAKLQSWVVACLTMTAAALQMGGAFIPNTPSTPPSPLPPSPGASDFLRHASERLRDNAFLKTMCKTGHKALNGAAGPFQIWQQSQITTTDSRRSLIDRVALSRNQMMQGTVESQTQQLYSSLQRLSQAKSQGGGT